MQAKLQDVFVGLAPSNVTAPRVGTPGYYWRAWHGCRALVNQLRRTVGREPHGCRLHTKENRYEFGTQLTVNCAFPAGDKRGQAYAARCIECLPADWDAEARAEIGLDIAHPTRAGKPKPSVPAKKGRRNPKPRTRKGGKP